MILAIIGKIGTAGGTGHVIEYAGEAIRALSMEGRMTVCNMSIEAGARAGLIAPDETTFDYLKGRPLRAQGAATGSRPSPYWRTLPTDEGARLRQGSRARCAEDIVPQVTWGTSPQDVLPITGIVPDPADVADQGKRRAVERALDYMGLTPGTPMNEVKVDKVFIGSCTNGRIEDLRAAAAVAKGRKVADGVHAMVVPGSGLVKEQAEEEGLDRDLQGGRLRMARARLLDVPRHERRPAEPRRALRLHLEPQLRGPAGPRRAHPPGRARRWPRPRR